MLERITPTTNMYLRNLFGDDSRSEAFQNGRFANAWGTKQLV